MEKAFITAEVPKELLDDLTAATEAHARRIGVRPERARSAVIRMLLSDALPRLFGDALGRTPGEAVPQ